MSEVDKRRKEYERAEADANRPGLKPHELENKRALAERARRRLLQVDPNAFARR